MLPLQKATNEDGYNTNHQNPGGWLWGLKSSATLLKKEDRKQKGRKEVKKEDNLVQDNKSSDVLPLA